MPTRPVKPLARLTGPLRGLLIAGVIGSALVGVFFLFVMNAAEEGRLEKSEFESLLILMVAHMGLLAAVAIVFVLWVHRANQNLHLLSGVPLRFTPGWAAGWFFVPVVGLYMPYLVVKEIWTVTHRGRTSSPSLLVWWWALYVAWWVLSFARLRPDPDDESVALLIAQGLTMYVVAAVGLGVTVMVVARIAAAYAASIDETQAVWSAATAAYAGAPAASSGPVFTQGGLMAQPAAGHAPAVQAAAGHASDLPPAGWHPDPHRRHQLRWWDGRTWTPYVLDGSLRSEDPI